ncbi:hypothetical protein BDW59DRAFT_31817 [Aspergillus cavernicola]|uniref:S-adenosyl-L-methionine-dependent methyltransferase n=1 Tax=Aspergillus cavernicola TaxID=176166 RepID=A0ABR4HCW6_9EURO
MANYEPTRLEWLRSLVDPGFILTKAMSYFITTNLKAILHGQILAPFLHAQELRDEAFGKFWIEFSCIRPPCPVLFSPPPKKDKAKREGLANRAVPPPPPNQTNPGEIKAPSELIPPILAHASGLVLDVGPGTGSQMPLLKSPEIKAIYGAEPCLGLHGELRKRAADEGLSAKYKILPCSVVGRELGPELERYGLGSGIGNGNGTEGVFDTIIAVRVLCSVPNSEITISELYALLKPGGKLLVVEHVVNPWRTAKGSLGARIMQGVYHALGWRWVMGDCCLNRDTERVLRGVALGDGGWESVEVERWFERTCLPHVAGVFVKKGGL